MNLRNLIFTACALAFCAGICGATDDENIARLNEQFKALTQENPNLYLKGVINTINSMIENHKEEIATLEAKHKKELETLEKKVKDLSNDLGSKNKGRYTMKEESALLWECIFGGISRSNNSGYYNSSSNSCLTKSEYERLADCCVRSVQKLQEKLPKFSDYQTLEGAISIKCVQE